MAKSSLTRICSVENCGMPHRGKGYCIKHLVRWERHGDVTVVKKPSHKPPLALNSEAFSLKFWSRIAITIDPDECWEWMKGRNKDGYGMIKVERKDIGAHRVAWMLTNKKKQTLNILHTCDNPPCCNPNHLYEGTHRQNMHDRNIRGRARGGRTNVKLTESQVLEIRQKITNGCKSDTVLAREYNISDSNIAFIRQGKIWKHLI